MDTLGIIKEALEKASRKYDPLNTYRMVDECSNHVVAENIARELTNQGLVIVRMYDVVEKEVEK